MQESWKPSCRLKIVAQMFAQIKSITILGQKEG